MSYSSNRNRPTNTDIYFSDLKRTSDVLLSREEESELVRRMQLGDETARLKLIQANLRFVVRVAKEYQCYCHSILSLNDLIQEGNIGLMTTLERFNNSKGYKFISYAVWWIRESILSTLAQHNRAIRIPDDKISQLEKISKFLKQFEDKNPLSHLEELTKELDTTPEDIEQLLISTQEIDSLDRFNGNGDEEYDYQSLYDTTPDTTERSPEEILLEETEREEISSVLDELSDREREILRLYFGIGGQRPFTLDEIGQRRGVTRERIRQIKKKALERLRHPARVQKLKALYY